MPVLKDYNEFEGLHWETGTLRNYLAYQGVRNPCTGEPYSEAFFLGVSGGAVMGYFSFAYEGQEPMARILTRNTFDPLDTILSRLGVVQTLVQTGNPDKGEANLVETLANGMPAIVWADTYSLPYNALPTEAGMWAMFPILVYGYEDAHDRVWIADRARVPLTVTSSELAAARARVKKDKFQMLTLGPPVPEKIPAAVNAGIWDCIRLSTENPPKGSKNNFGLAAFRWWADLLFKPKARLSWEKVFPAGEKFYAGLTSALYDIHIFGKDGPAEREVYAEFLDEAAILISNPALHEAAGHFRTSAEAWKRMSTALLPDEIPLFQETRKLMLRRHQGFLEGGNAALGEMQAIDQRLAEIRSEITPDHPIGPAEVADLREDIRAHVLAVHDVEQEAVAILQKAMG